MNEEDNYSWPGWSLQDNPFGTEFDLEARRRMIQNSCLLLPLIQKHGPGEIIMEAGPFFNPLITPDRFPSIRQIIYTDNDPYVIQYLTVRHNSPQIKIQAADLENFKPDSIPRPVDSIIVSHLWNYLDYRKFLENVKPLLKPNGLLFLNHSVDYGLAFFFSEKRPKNLREIIIVLAKMGFEMIEQNIIPTDHPQHQPHERLLLVAKRK